MDANLIITYDAIHTDSSREAVKAVFRKTGIKPEFLESEFSGIFFVNVPDAREAIKKLKVLSKNSKEIFGWTYHYIPVDKWVSSDIEEMQEAVKTLGQGIGDNEKWKLELVKRHYHRYHDRELILKLTDMIDTGKVDLENPQKIIQVEIIGKHAGISLLDPQDILSVSKA